MKYQNIKGKKIIFIFIFIIQSVSEKLANQCKDFKVSSCVKQTVPIVDWLYNYKWKINIVKDITAGVTVAVMHIPQGTFLLPFYL